MPIDRIHTRCKINKKRLPLDRATAQAGLGLCCLHMCLLVAAHLTFNSFAASFGSAAAVCQAGMTGQFCNKCKYNLVFKERVCCLRPVTAVYQWCPCTSGSRVPVAAVYQWRPCTSGGRVSVAAVYRWRPLTSGGRVSVAAVYQWRPFTSSGRVPVAAVYQ